MMIHEVCRLTGLTRKAIEYYAAQGLIRPQAQENGYRDFSDNDAAKLQKIAVLRGLNVPVEQIRAILADDGALQAAGVRAQLELQRAQQRQTLLDRLCAGETYEAIRAELDAIDAHRAIIDRLTDAFPGFYGRYMVLHFAPFLTGTIDTDDQRAAYEEAVAWLDDAPPLPEAIRQWLEASLAGITSGDMAAMNVRMREEIADADGFLQKYENALAHREEYLSSPAYAITRQAKEFLQGCGYYDIFIPALRRLSPAYDEYSRQLEALGERLK